MKNILTLMIGIFFLINVLGIISADNYWVTNPANCPTTYQSQTCTGTKVVCGYTGGITYCSEPGVVIAPSSPGTSNTDISGSFNGGFLIDCYAYQGSTPHCMPALCDRNSTCYTTNQRDTTCSANVFGASTCGNCRSTYLNCSGYACGTQIGVTTYTQPHTTYLTCNSGQCSSGYQNCTGALETEGCLIQTGVTSCTTGGSPGVYGASCSCVAVAQSDIYTNTFTNAFGSNWLWGNQSNPNGWLMNLSVNGKTIGINNNSCFVFSDGSTQCNASANVDLSSVWNAIGNETLNRENNDSAIINLFGNYYNKSQIDTLLLNAGNSSWNQSLADTLYLGINDQRYNETSLIYWTLNGNVIQPKVLSHDLRVGNLTFSGNTITADQDAGLNINAPTNPSAINKYFNLASGRLWINEGGYNQLGSDAVWFQLGGSTTPGGAFRIKQGNNGDNDVLSLNYPQNVSSFGNPTDNHTVNIYGYLNLTGSSNIDSVGRFVGLTSNSFNGSAGGYSGFNGNCSASYSGSHLCSYSELKNSIDKGVSLTSGQFWISTGVPGYTANANDCLGWTSSDSTYLGPFWDTTATTDVGAGFLKNCANSQKGACCK